MMPEDWLARVSRPGQFLIELRADWTWYPVPGDPAALSDSFADEANLLGEGHVYGPADGQPGARLAALVANALGGAVELPSTAEEPEDLDKKL
jgi:hypothetical protein